MQKLLQISMAAARVNAKLSQEEIGEKMGVTRQAVANWENGRVTPGIPEINMFASLCGLPTDNIIFPKPLQKVDK